MPVKQNPSHWSKDLSHDRDDHGETRLIALGRAGLEVYRVVYAWRSENKIRVISAQKANHEERATYYREIFPERD